MTSIHRPPSPQVPSDLLLGVIIAIAVTGIPSIVQYFLDQQKYEAAMQSYKMADCSTASEEFNKIIRAFRLVDVGEYVPRAKQKKAKCDFFENAVRDQEEGQFESALLNYAKVAVYDNSALFEPIRRNLGELFQKSNIETIATSEVCNRVETLADKNLLPKSDVNLPSLYPACAKIHEADERYKRAIFTYEQFLKQYPDHPLVKDIKRDLARTIVIDVKADKGRLDIKSPGRTGTTEDGSTVVNIQNSSPAKMHITFSGITPKFEELEACNDCQRYVNKSPEFCTQKGPIGRYRIEPGQYEIAVKFSANDGYPVNPWAGNWNLEPGAEYSSCFFIIQNPLGNLEDLVED